MRAMRSRMSRHADIAKAIDYMLKRWDAFTRFLDDGRICLTNNAAERALRGVALGRKSWLFAVSDEGAPCCPSSYVPTIKRILERVLRCRGSGTTEVGLAPHLSV
jgi:transposase